MLFLLLSTFGYGSVLSTLDMVVSIVHCKTWIVRAINNVEMVSEMSDLDLLISVNISIP